MSYLDNGSTLRAMFRLTPPMRHDADPTRSEVVAYIRENLRCELGRAIRAFDSMRHLKSAVLIYDRIHRQWRGCDWVPAEEVDKISLLMSVVTELKRDISSLRSELRKVKNEMVSLRRRKGGRKDDEEVADSEDDSEPKPEQQQAAPKTEAAIREDYLKYWNNINESLYPEEKVSSPSTPPQSLASDSTDPTECPWENAEDEVS
jgi:hypothetical protein